MALTAANCEMVVSWVQTKVVTNFLSGRQTGPVRSVVSPPIGASDCNRVYFVRSTLAAGATATIDLRSLTDPAFGEALTPARIYASLVQIDTATGRYMPGAANPLVWPFNAAADAINFAATATYSGAFAFGIGVAGTIDATNRNVRIINTHGSTTLTYTAVFLLGV